MFELDLLNRLLGERWSVIRMMPGPDKVYFGIVVECERGMIGILGKDHLLPTRVDVFSLRVYEHVDTAGSMWSPASGWQAVYLDQLWHGTPMEGLLTPPRSLTMFSEPCMGDVITPVESPMDRCTVLELYKNLGEQRLSLVIAAEQGNAMCIHVTTDPEERARLLEDTSELDQSRLSWS